MKITKINLSFIFFLTFMVVSIIVGGCRIGKSDASKLASRETPAEKKDSAETPADLQIASAERLVEKDPRRAGNHVKLAAAILKKVRETGDYSLNRRAEKAIGRALEIEPDNFAARILKMQIYLSEHEFQKALDLGKKLEQKNPDSEALLAAITDAETELGKYEEAVRSAQKFVDFRPNANSYARIAHLRSLYGDTDGAIEVRKKALQIVDPDDKEILAWHHSQLGKEYFNIGKFAEAETEFDLALKIFPEYHWALEGKGKVRAAQNDFEKAVEVFERLNQRSRETVRTIFLGDLYLRLGKTAEAEKIYRETVKRQTESGGDMHRIALFWADHDRNLDEALKIAKADRQVNADLLSSDTLAWCLYKKGDYRQARKYIREAMRLKTKNALFYYHAGMIEKETGNKLEAVRLLKLALQTNPSFDLLQSEIAKKTLTELEKKKD